MQLSNRCRLNWAVINGLSVQRSEPEGRDLRMWIEPVCLAHLGWEIGDAKIQQWDETGQRALRCKSKVVRFCEGQFVVGTSFINIHFFACSIFFRLLLVA